MKEGEKESREECEADAKTKQEKKDCTPSEDDWIPPMPSFKRGASTITQQLAKNLYLSEDRNFLRKGREAVYTYFLERNLPKKRILELYLNVIEWGDGVYVPKLRRELTSISLRRISPGKRQRFFRR
jgi:monofunctional biosynthetic peptidoglycan transglycosylase